ncbi:MAG: hypothetical protein WD767_06995 [Alphaproteobacteria bacterium]
MYGVLRRHEEQSGTDYQDRLFLSFDKMFSREKTSALGEIFDYWKFRRNEQVGLPTVDTFRPKDEMPSGNSRAITMVDVTYSDPANFLFFSHPQYTRGFFDLSRRRLGDHPSLMNVKSCAADYLYCMISRKPIYHEIIQTIGNANRHYVRLALPIADNSGRVVNLAYAIRMIG